MNLLSYMKTLKGVLEYVGGSADQIAPASPQESARPNPFENKSAVLVPSSSLSPPGGEGIREMGPLSRFEAMASTWWFRGLWWGVLAGIILLFCGQTSKFIYIDF